MQLLSILLHNIATMTAERKEIEPVKSASAHTLSVTDKERDVGCVCHGMKRRRPLRHDAAKIAARGADREDRSADG